MCSGLPCHVSANDTCRPSRGAMADVMPLAQVITRSPRTLSIRYNTTFRILHSLFHGKPGGGGSTAFTGDDLAGDGTWYLITMPVK